MTLEEKLIDLVKRKDWVGLLREMRREGFLPRSAGFLPGDLVNVWTATIGKQPGEMICSSENGVTIKPAGSKFTGEEAFFPYSSVQCVEKVDSLEEESEEEKQNRQMNEVILNIMRSGNR